MDSIWKLWQQRRERETGTTVQARMPLPSRADVVVIGAGLAGLLTAWELRQSGLEVVVLEAAAPASGQTGHSTAKATAQHGACYSRLLREVGEEQAALYAQANLEAVDRLRDLCRQLGVGDCFEDRDSFLYSTAQPSPLLEEEARACERLGLATRLLTGRELSLPFPAKTALGLSGQGQLDPLRLSLRLAGELEVHAGVPALAVEGGRVATPRGTIQAEHVVAAVHFPWRELPGAYSLRMYQQRSYVVALEGVPQLEGTYLEADPPGHSLRSAGKLLLLGGEGHRTGENPSPGNYHRLLCQAQEWFPGCREVARWSAQDCMTLDGIPYIGQCGADSPGLYVATGFGKWGMSSSMVSALLLRDLILNRDNPWAQVFSPQRGNLAASAPNFLKNGGKAAKGLAKRLTLPREKLEQLAPGQGAVVDYEGESAAVYRDPEGEFFILPACCPHLGCRLEWNPEERTWECPCHGSRFDYTGKCLDGPSQQDLEQE